jgi:hypothetical protein
MIVLLLGFDDPDDGLQSRPRNTTYIRRTTNVPTPRPNINR